MGRGGGGDRNVEQRSASSQIHPVSIVECAHIIESRRPHESSSWSWPPQSGRTLDATTLLATTERGAASANGDYGHHTYTPGGENIAKGFRNDDGGG